MLELYKAVLMDHYQNPRHKKTIDRPDFKSQIHNPSCGDVVMVTGTMKGGAIATVGFDGHGCVISQAAASMLLEKIAAMPVVAVQALDKKYIINLIQIPLGPTRLKCALLSLQVLQEALAHIKNDGVKA